MDDNKWQLMTPDIALQITYTRPTPQKLVLPQLGIVTTVYQAHDSAIFPYLKSACIMQQPSPSFSGWGLPPSSMRGAKFVGVPPSYLQGRWRNAAGATSPPHQYTPPLV